MTGNENTNGSPPEKLLPQELVVTRVLHQRMVKEDCLQPGDRESVAYRVAEIMVAAKELYTKTLPQILAEEENKAPVFEDLAGLRMAFLHLRDLVCDFEDAFMEAMHHQREIDEEEAEDGEE